MIHSMPVRAALATLVLKLVQTLADFERFACAAASNPRHAQGSRLRLGTCEALNLLCTCRHGAQSRRTVRSFRAEGNE